MSTNPIPTNVTLVLEDQDAVMNAIATIRQKLPFLVDLTKEDRKTMAKLGNKSQAFVKKAVDVAVQNPGILPATFDLNQVRNITQLLDDLGPIQIAVDQLKKQLDDTVIATGSQAYQSARDVYAVAKSRFGRAKLETAASDLGQRFRKKKSGNGRNGSSGSTPATSPPSHQPS